MTRKKRSSRALEKADIRIAGLKAINAQLNFGDDRSVENMSQKVEQLRTRIEEYNRALAIIDSGKTEIKTMEKSLSELAEKMLDGVASKYGKDSSEYEMAGGTRKSDRARKSSATRRKNQAKKAVVESEQPAA